MHNHAHINFHICSCHNVAYMHLYIMCLYSNCISLSTNYNMTKMYFLAVQLDLLKRFMEIQYILAILCSSPLLGLGSISNNLSIIIFKFSTNYLKIFFIVNYKSYCNCVSSQLHVPAAIPEKLALQKLQRLLPHI